MAELFHDGDGQVVHQAAVDQDLAVFDRRRSDAGDRDAGAHGFPQHAGAMNFCLGSGQVRRHAKKFSAQVFNLTVAKHASEHLVHALAGVQSDERQGVISLGLAARPSFSVYADHGLPIPAESVLRGDNRAHTRAADGIDRDTALAQGANHADMRESARAAAAQDQAHRRGGQKTR